MIAKIVTHPKPHPDEALAIWLLRNFGEDKFPGASAAQIVFCGGDPKEIADIKKKNDSIFVGIGGGVFDEHPANGSRRKEDECAATLVAKALLLDDDPVIEPLLRFVTRNDLKGSRQPFDIADVMQAMGRNGQFLDEEVLNWASAAFDAKASEQQRFIEEARGEYAKAKIMQIRHGNGTAILAVVESDHDQVARYARWQGADIVVQKWTTGHVRIFTSRRAMISLTEVARMLRYEEQRLSGKIVVTSWDALSEERVEGIAEWYYHKAAEQMLNGSMSVPNIPPTRIPLAQIVECVKIALDQSRWPASHAAQCGKGKCTANQHPCPFYNWGLSRCRHTRYETARKKAAS